MNLQVHSALILMLLVGAKQSLVMSQSCFREDIPPGDLGNSNSVSLPSNTQAIVTSYQFQCCGDITAWQTYVRPDGPNHRDGVYSITFQVWRPLPTVDTDGCYSYVGEDIYTNIQLIEDEDGLVNRTLDPSSFISVQPGDVLGYYTYLDDEEEGGIQHDPNFNAESVWYHTSTDDAPLMSRGDTESCPFPVGVDTSTRVLTTFSPIGPVFSVEIASYSCPTTQPHTEEAATTADMTTNTPQQQTTGSASTAGKDTGSNTVLTGTIAGVCCLAVISVILLIILAVCITTTRRRAATRISSLPEPSDKCEDIEMTANDCYEGIFLKNSAQIPLRSYATQHLTAEFYGN